MKITWGDKLSKDINILYSFRRCPFAMRARMALIISSIEYEHREIILRNKPASMLAASPKGTVPVLILRDGTLIDESLDIMVWALRHNDPQHWLGDNFSAMTDLITKTQSDFKPHLDRYKYASRYHDDAKRAELDLEHRAKAESFIAKLEARLNDNSYLFGPAPCLADYAIFPFIRQFANTDRGWWNGTQYTKVQGWLEGFLASQLFKACMEKHELWQEPETLKF